MADRIARFDDFFLHYLREHARPATRAWHYFGTTLVVALFIAALVTGRWWLAGLMPVAGYGFAWAAHGLVERNRPATFTYPGWSLVSDFKMWGLWLTGRLRPYLVRAGVTAP